MYSATVSEGYQRLLRQMDLDGDGKISSSELWKHLHCREKHIQDQLQRFIVKHHSEWVHDASSALWQGTLAEMAKRFPGDAEYNRQHINAMVWMKHVPEIRSGEALWHLHPVAFLEALAEGHRCACNRDITLDELLKIAPNADKEKLEQYLPAFNEGFREFGMTTCREKAHFLAQCCHESGGLRLTVEGGGSEKDYAPWYGCGLIQLTWRDTYEKYGIYAGEDFLSNGLSRDKVAMYPHCVKSAFWFYCVNKRVASLLDKMI